MRRIPPSASEEAGTTLQELFDDRVRRAAGPRPRIGNVSQTARDGCRQPPGDVGGQRGHRRQLAGRQLAGEQTDEDGRRPPEVHGALEAGTGTAAALADPDQLVGVAQHLARAEPGEAHERAPARARHRTTGGRRRQSTPSSVSAVATCSPSHTIDAPTSSPTPALRSSSAGTTTSNHTTPSGSSNTTPPPLRRWTTSTPASAHAWMSTSPSRCADPSTSAGRSTSNTHSSASGRSPIVRAWKSAADPRNDRTANRRHTIRRRSRGMASTPRAREPR